MKILALDVGDATIGLAISDELGITAGGLETIRRKSLAKDLETLRSVIAETGAQKLVVGMPYNMDGSMSAQTEKTMAFKETLLELGLPVDEMDERWTSKAADRALLEGDMSRKKRKKLIDKVAAVLILQSYLQTPAAKQ